MEAVLALAAVGGDDHAHRDRGAVDAGLERAQVVGDALRQHRHHAVGEVHGIAAHQRLAVERRARRDVMGDIGDGDVDDEAAGILGVGVGPRIDRVVMVLGVDGIDGDEGDLAPVLAAVEAGGARRLRLVEGFAAELVGNAVGMDGDEAHRLFGGERAEPFHHPGARQAEPAAAC